MGEDSYFNHIEHSTWHSEYNTWDNRVLGQGQENLVNLPSWSWLRKGNAFLRWGNNPFQDSKFRYQWLIYWHVPKKWTLAIKTNSGRSGEKTKEAVEKGKEIQSSKVCKNSMFNILRTSPLNCFPWQLYHFAFPAATYEGSNLSTPSTTCYFCNMFCFCFCFIAILVGIKW